MDPKDEDLEMQVRSAEERRDIVARYDKGRDTEEHIDDWEDPKLEIYHTQDRYGFIHDTRLPDRGRTEREQKQIRQENLRSMKWVEMTKDEKKYFDPKGRHREKMINRMYKGMPDSVRGKVWYIILDLERMKAVQKGTYQKMRSLARECSPDIRQIDLDVNRTYRNHMMFRERYNQRQQALFHVLAAYSMYNSEIGYCQGMSQIAALLLMYLNEEEDVFWALSQLMVGPRYQMHGFFIQGFPKLLRFQTHHERILKKFSPKLKKHLDKNGIDTGIYTLKWFFQCFLDRIPFSLTLRVWDLYLLEGERVMIGMAYNILRMHRRNLMKLGMDELIEFLQISLEKDFLYEDDHVIDRLREVISDLASNNLDRPGQAPQTEIPQKPFGLVDPNLLREANRLLGMRTALTDKEREFSHKVIRKQQLDEEESRKGDQDVDEGSDLDDTSSLPDTVFNTSTNLIVPPKNETSSQSSSVSSYPDKLFEHHSSVKKHHNHYPKSSSTSSGTSNPNLHSDSLIKNKTRRDQRSHDEDRHFRAVSSSPIKTNKEHLLSARESQHKRPHSEAIERLDDSMRILEETARDLDVNGYIGDSKDLSRNGRQYFAEEVTKKHRQGHKQSSTEVTRVTSTKSANNRNNGVLISQSDSQSVRKRTEKISHSKSEQNTLISKGDVVRIHVPYTPEKCNDEVTIMTTETNRTFSSSSGGLTFPGSARSENKRLSGPP